MPIGFPASNSYLYREGAGTAPNTNGAYTVTGRVYSNVLSGTRSWFDSGSGTRSSSTNANQGRELIGTTGDKLLYTTRNEASGVISQPFSTVAVPLQQWYFVSVRRTSATSARVDYWDEATETIVATVISTADVSARAARNWLAFGFSLTSGNGSLDSVKVWEGVTLSDADIIAEMPYMNPQTNLANKWAVYRFDFASEATVDSSGNGRTLTANGSINDGQAARSAYILGDDPAPSGPDRIEYDQQPQGPYTVGDDAQIIGKAVSGAGGATDDTIDTGTASLYWSDDLVTPIEVEPWLDGEVFFTHTLLEAEIGAGRSFVIKDDGAGSGSRFDDSAPSDQFDVEEEPEATTLALVEAEVLNGGGQPLRGRVVEWVISGDPVVTVTPAASLTDSSGIARASIASIPGTSGEATVTGIVGAQQDACVVTVTPVG